MTDHVTRHLELCPQCGVQVRVDRLANHLQRVHNAAGVPKTTKTGKPLTKSEVYQEIANETELTKKKVEKIFSALQELIQREIGEKNGVFILPPGLLEIKRAEKEATEERIGRNPQTGEEVTTPAKPKRTVVRAQALKALKALLDKPKVKQLSNDSARRRRSIWVVGEGQCRKPGSHRSWA